MKILIAICNIFLLCSMFAAIRISKRNQIKIEQTQNEKIFKEIK